MLALHGVELDSAGAGPMADAGEAARVSVSDGVGRLPLEMLTGCMAAFR